MQANKRSIQVIAVCALLSVVWVSSMTAAGKPRSTPVATFHFLNGFDVSGDTVSEYKDYRLADLTNPNDVNYCVEASPSTTGLFIRLNRKLDGDAGSLFCERQNVPGRIQTPRTITLHIRSFDACNELHSANLPASYVVDDANPQDGCTFGNFDKPRIRISSDIYAKRTTSTPVAFLEETYNVSDIAYEVRTDTEAFITLDSMLPNRRTVSSAGTAHLVRFVPGQNEVAVVPSFPLTFSIVIDKL